MEARVTDYFSRIWHLRYFWLSLVRVDLQRRYRRSMIGMGWSLLQPIAMTTVLCVVFSQVFHHPIKEYGPFLLTGLTFWGFMTAVVIQGCNSFIQGESYIRQHPAPLAIYPLRTTLGAGFHFMLGFGVAVIFVCAVNGLGTLLMLPCLIPTLVMLLLFGWSLAICMGVANVLFHDSEHLIEVAMQIMFYATPILLKPEFFLQRRLVSWVVKLNPLAAFLELIRNPLLEGQLPSWWAIYMATGATLAAMIMASLALRCFEKRMIFYL